MNASEISAARVELKLTQPELAEQLGVEAHKLREWELGLKDAPKNVGKTLEWLLAMMRRERTMQASGLPDCEWVERWENEPEPETYGEIKDRAQQIRVHSDTCSVCQARKAYAAKHLGPSPPMPNRGWLAILTPLFTLGLMMPAWLRPALFGAAFLIFIVGIRLVFAIPLLFAGRVSLLSALLALAAAGAGGAIGGLGYSLVGKPLRRIPVIGGHLAGVATVSAYLFGLAAMAPYAFGETLIKDRTDWYIFGFCAVLFGAVFGHSAFRDSPERAGRPPNSIKPD